eukprot:CAMPEP_0206243400 /NCGR_PEP_ID=MMETSP0047_2-20121206/17587_1 /ASSEMBLY_ACC=CAM_ASM_000192 /TAXON_ID=195065 /ORGANISM="Chroomonas mesostigmatica_cf, Strain CCMP1168" /LENGTH=268 /DNA_ID=CAMNT_0053668517 /DNA_START=25 /DNA_END=828 /DNA_ORIENTATION=+
MKVKGEGNDQPRKPEDELPIDINYAKFETWLSDRQKIKPTWRNSLRLIQQKVQAAVENLPDNPQLNNVKAGINVADMNYFTCKKIRDVLTSDKDTAQKNWLGQYKSQATKDWEAILRLYDKDNVHLAEAAQVLYQNVQYEVPALRKVVTNCQKQQQEMHRKEAQYNKVLGEYRERYQKECSKLGIKGKDVRSELLEKSKDLPNIYKSVLESVKTSDMAAARDVYCAFVRYSTGAKEDLDLLPILKGVQSAEVPAMDVLEQIAFADDAV